MVSAAAFLLTRLSRKYAYQVLLAEEFYRGGVSGFRKKLHARAQTLDVKERQQILRLLVKEILVGFDTLTIRHSIPIPSGDGPPPNVPGSTPLPTTRLSFASQAFTPETMFPN